MGDVPFVNFFTKSKRPGMSEIYGSVGFAPFRCLRIAPTFGPSLSTMRERGAVGDLTRLEAQAVGTQGVTFRRLRAWFEAGCKRRKTIRGKELERYRTW